MRGLLYVRVDHMLQRLFVRLQQRPASVWALQRLVFQRVRLLGRGGHVPSRRSLPTRSVAHVRGHRYVRDYILLDCLPLLLLQ